MITDFEDAEELHAYTPRDLERLLKLSASLLRSLEDAGLIRKSLAEGRTAYTWQDMLILRSAAALQEANVPAALIAGATAQLSGALPKSALLSLLSLATEHATRTDAMEGSSSSRSEKMPEASPNLEVAHAHYEKAYALEESDVAAARAAYLDALEAHSEHLEARINLGRLLHLSGELEDAEKVYRQAKSSSALLSFNLAVLLEDLHREEEAAAAYRDALSQDPAMHDAHFNLARLHERAQRSRDALRHLLAYRRHAADTDG